MVSLRRPQQRVFVAAHFHVNAAISDQLKESVRSPNLPRHLEAKTDGLPPAAPNAGGN
jgi:hypothetical protein